MPEREAPIVVTERVGQMLGWVPMAMRGWPVLRRWYWQDSQLRALDARVDDLAEALDWYPVAGLPVSEEPDE